MQPEKPLTQFVSAHVAEFAHEHQGRSPGVLWMSPGMFYLVQAEALIVQVAFCSDDLKLPANAKFGGIPIRFLPGMKVATVASPRLP